MKIKKAKENEASGRIGRRDPKIYVLIAVSLLAVISIGYQTFRPHAKISMASATDKTAARTGRGGTKDDPIKSRDVPLNYGDLADQPLLFSAEERNVFSFHVPPPPVQMASAARPQNETETKPPPPPPAPVCGDGTCQPPERFENCPSDCPPVLQPITLKYIGYVGYAKETNGPVAFFTDGKEVFMGKVNDVIINKYKVINITDQNVELGYVNLPPNYSKTIQFEGNDRS